jgi:hypothetical protein
MRNRKFYKAGGRFSMVTGGLLFLGFFLGVAMSAILFNHWRTAILGHRYTEQIFVVETVRFGKTKQHGGGDIPIATGTVNGNPEAKSLADLEQDFPRGSHLDILYDSSASTMLTQGATLRALPPSSNLHWAWVRALGLTMIPGSLVLVGAIGQLICVKRRR